MPDFVAYTDKQLDVVLQRLGDGVYTIVEGLALSDYDKQMIAATGQELVEEREAIADMLG